MFGITEKYNELKENPNFIRFKDGAKFVSYSFGIYLVTTFAVGCLGLMIGSPFLMMPLAILISNPIAWIVIGVALAATYKIAVKPLFHFVKDFINEKRTPKKEKGEEKAVELQKQNAGEHKLTRSTSVDSLVVPDNTIKNGKTRSLSVDSGLDSISRSSSTKTLAKNQERPKTLDRDSGIVMPKIEKNSFITATNKGDYKCWLKDNDIVGIAENYYRWNINGEKINSDAKVFFAYSYVSAQLETYLAKYKNKVEQGNNSLIFASIFRLHENHFVTLVISHDEENKKFRAYYCDSFGNKLPDEISDVLLKTLGIDSSNVGISKTKQQNDDYNCGIFALYNAKKITDMLKKGESFDKIGNVLSKCKFSLERKRKEFAKVLEENAKSRASIPVDSGISTLDSSPVSEGPENRSRKSSGDSAASSDSGVSVGNKEFHKDWPTLVHQTNRKNSGYWLQQHDISYVARIQYGYSEASTNDVFFSIPGDVSSLNERLKEYKNKVEQENSKKTFTSVINLGGNHWVTLIVTYDPTSKQFVAYYCDSFGTQLPSKINGMIKDSISLANEITEKCVEPLTNEVGNLIREKESNPDNMLIKDKKDDVAETLSYASKDRNKLVSKQICTTYIVGVLQETLGINDIRSSKTQQQSDGYNCGIFALENAHRITQMLSEGKSFDEVDEKLSKNIPNKEELMEKRQEFTRVLMNDEEWKGDIAEDGILHDTIQQLILERNGEKNESVMTNIASIIQGAAAACVTTCKNVLGLSSNL